MMKRKNKASFLLLLFILILILVCLISLFAIFRTAQVVEAKEAALTEGRVNIHLQQESSPFDVQREAYDTLLEQLYGGEHFTYYEIYNQYLIPSESMDTTRFCMEEGTTQIRCRQIGFNVQEAFGLSVEEGRSLAENDFVYAGIGTIPVLMGHEYKDRFSLGDIFSCDYLYITYSFQVVGFLSEGAVLNLPLSYTPLDDCIVMPMFGLPEYIDLESTRPLKIHLANRVSGHALAHPGEGAEAYAELEAILQDCTSAGTFSLSANSLEATGQMSVSFQLLSIGAGLAAAVVLIFILLLARKKMVPMRWWGVVLSFPLTAAPSFILMTLLAGLLYIHLPMQFRVILPMAIWGVVTLCLQLPRKGEATVQTEK